MVHLEAVFRSKFSGLTTVFSMGKVGRFVGKTRKKQAYRRRSSRKNVPDLHFAYFGRRAGTKTRFFGAGVSVDDCLVDTMLDCLHIEKSRRLRQDCTGSVVSS